MTDLISRADAIAYIDRVIKSGLGRYKSLDYIHKYISSLPSADAVHIGIYRELYEKYVKLKHASAEAVQGWIPCSERMPKEEKKTYWVCTDTEYQCECRWTNNRFGIGEGEWGWSIFDTPQYSKPIAWMPLPKPYKGGDTE